MNNFESKRTFSLKKRQKPMKNYNIINDFDSINEKQCIKLDKENESIYNKLLAKSKQAQYTIQNTGLSMNLEVPMPPRPNNRDRFMLWKKRNVQKPVIKQTEAVLFLHDNGYKLNIHYEAYQAIDLFNEIRKNKGIKNHYIDNTKNFDNLYTKKDKNIFRRKSMYGLESLSMNNFDSCNQTVNQPNRSQSFNGQQSSNSVNIPHRSQSLNNGQTVTPNFPNRSQSFNGDFNSNSNSNIDSLNNFNSTYNKDYNNLEYLLENNQLNMDLNIFDNQSQDQCQDQRQNHYHEEQIRTYTTPSAPSAPSAPAYNTVLASAPPQDSFINESIDIDSDDEDFCKNSKNNCGTKVANNSEKRNSLYPCL